MTVEVIQFMLPNGRQVRQTTQVPDDCAPGYEAMRAAGLRLTAEMLTTGEVSLCIEHPGEGDYAIDVVSNGPAVQDSIARMLREFDGKKCRQWLKEVRA
jgi:hypothetical protein